MLLRAASMAVLTVCATACEDPPQVRLDTPPPRSVAPLSRPAPPPMRDAGRVDSAGGAASERRKSERRAASAVEASVEDDLPDASDPRGVAVGRWLFDSLVDVAQAGPITATASGLVMVNRENHLQHAALSTPPRDPSPAATPLRALPESAGPFPLAAGPAVSEGSAYWVSTGRLLREQLPFAGKGRPAQILAEDARVGTRVAVVRGDPHVARKYGPMVGYIGRAREPGGALSARLWSGRPQTLSLSVAQSTATSVQLVASQGEIWAAVLEARTGMSTVHARVLRRAKDGGLEMGEDHVVWVGGPARASTQLLLLPPKAKNSPVRALMALERDMLHFGLARLSLSVEKLDQVASSSWLSYPNGIEPAPFSAVDVCGNRYLAVAQPASKQPHSVQRLLWLPLDASQLEEAIVVARSKAFFDVSVSRVTNRAALLSYVADHRTWARTIRCQPSKS